MAEAAGGSVLGAHKVVDRCAEGLLPVRSGRGFRWETHDLTGAVEDLHTVRWWNDLGPGVRVGVFAGAAVEVAEEAEVEVGALRAADVAVPDCGAAEVAGSDDGVGKSDELDRGRRVVVNRFVVDHLAEEAGEKG